MKKCPGFEAARIVLMATGEGKEQCAKCKHREDIYCKPTGTWERVTVGPLKKTFS